MALPENAIGFTDRIPLEPADMTDDILDQLHSGVDEDVVLSWALARNVVHHRTRLPMRLLDLSDDGDLFDFVMR
jgi:hypothetical protein